MSEKCSRSRGDTALYSCADDRFGSIRSPKQLCMHTPRHGTSSRDSRAYLHVGLSKKKRHKRYEGFRASLLQYVLWTRPEQWRRTVPFFIGTTDTGNNVSLRQLPPTPSPPARLGSNTSTATAANPAAAAAAAAANTSSTPKQDPPKNTAATAAGPSPGWPNSP